MIQPQIHLIEEGVTSQVYANTYRELKKAIKRCIEDGDEDMVYVYRSRRGQWGEWFEHWKLDDDGKPGIIKEGWS